MWNSLLNTLQLRRDYSIIPAGLSWRSNTFFILATITMALFSDLFLFALIVPVFPFMLESRIGVPEDQIQSVVSGLLAANAGASIVASPISGVIADRLSARQLPFMIGLLALLASTVLFFLGTTVPVLVLGRVLQGISGGTVWTIGLAMAVETVGPENLGKTMGTIFSICTVGNLAAPVLGGIIYEKTGYGGVFAIGCAVLVVDFVMRLAVIEKKVALQYRPDDHGSDGAVATPPAAADGDSSNERGEPTVPDAGENEPLLGKHLQQDDFDYSISPEQPFICRLVPFLPCLAHPGMLVAFLMALVQATLYGSIDATVVIVGNELFGFNSLESGLLFVPLGVFDLVLGPVMGWCVDRFGTKPVAIAGFAGAVPTLILLRLPHAGGTDQIALYASLLGLLGMTFAAMVGPSVVEQSVVTQKYYAANPGYFGKNGPYAQLYGLSNMVFSFGLTVGPELAGEVKQAIGYGNMNLVLAIICAVTAVLSYLYVGGRPKILRKRQTGRVEN